MRKIKKIGSTILALALMANLFSGVACAEVGGVTYNDPGLEIDISEETADQLSETLATKFSGDNEVNICFIGGSITQGAGGKLVNFVPLAYAQRVGRRLEAMIEADSTKTANVYNFGIGGTTSQYGAFRFAKQVLEKDPDLVFVEFAVNDSTASFTGEYMESIVRQLYKEKPDAYIVFLYSYGSTVYGGKSAPQKHSPVADYYGISGIDFHNYIIDTYMPAKKAMYENDPENLWNNPQTTEDKIFVDNMKTDWSGVAYPDYEAYAEYVAGKASQSSETVGSDFWENTIMTDSVHPNTAGYYVYSRYILEQIASGEKINKITWVEEPMYDLSKKGSPKFTAIQDNVHLDGSGWTKNNSALLSGTNDGYYTSSNAGDKATFYFYGSYIGIFAQNSSAAGKFKYTVDDTYTGVHSLRKAAPANGQTAYNDGAVSLRDLDKDETTKLNLNEGWHKLVLENLAFEENGQTITDATVNIGYFGTISGLEEAELVSASVNGEDIGIVSDSITIPEGTTKFSLKFNGYPNKGSLENAVSVYSGETEISSRVTVDYDDMSCSITLPAQAEKGQNLNISIDGAEFGEYLLDAALDIDVTESLRLYNLMLTDATNKEIVSTTQLASGKVNVTLKATSVSEEGEPVALIAVHKDSDGVLKNIGSDDCVVSKISGEKTLSAPLTSFAADDGDVIEIYIWDGLNTLEPLTEKIIFSTDSATIVQGGEGLTAFVINTESVRDKITALSAERNSMLGTVEVSATVTDAEFVTFKLVNSTGEIKYLNQQQLTNGQTEVDFSCKTGILPSGIYTIYVSCN